MKVTIDIEDVKDNLVAQILLDSIDCNYQFIGELQEYDSLQDYQQEDLKDAKKQLKALKTVYKYYTPCDEWGALDKYE